MSFGHGVLLTQLDQAAVQGERAQSFFDIHGFVFAVGEVEVSRPDDQGFEAGLAQFGRVRCAAEQRRLNRQRAVLKRPFDFLAERGSRGRRPALAAVGDREFPGDIRVPERFIEQAALLQLELHKHGMSLADMKIKEILTSDSVAVFADTSLAAVVTYQPFLQQIMSIDEARKPKVLVSSADYPDYIVDVMIARNDDLAASPGKYSRFLSCIYKAVDYHRTHNAEFARVAAPHFNLSVDDFQKSINGSLEYTGLEQSAAYMGTPQKPGPINGIFNTLMDLNVENGAASVKLDATRAINSAPIAALSTP